MTDFLFAKPSIFSGIATCVDLFGIYIAYNESHDEKSADKRALTADVLAIKNDFAKAFYGVTNEK